MENKRKWNPVDELDGMSELLNSGAVPEGTAYSLDDILKEYGEEEEPTASLTEAEPVSVPEQRKEAEPELPSEPEEMPEPEEEPFSEEMEEEPLPAPDENEPDEPVSTEGEEEPIDFMDTAAFVGQQVTNAIGEAEPEDPENDTTVNGLRKFFIEAKRKSADKKLRKEQLRREQAVIEEAAAAMAEAAKVEEPEDKVVEMPVPKAKAFRDSFGRIQDKLHDFADNMYSEAGTPEQDSTKAFVTGTDEEEAPPEKKVRRERRPRKQFPKAPDVSAEELASRYRLGLLFMKKRIYYILVLTLVMLYLSVAEASKLPLLSGLMNHRVMSGVLTWGLALGGAIGLDVIWLGLTAPVRGRMGMHTLTALAVLATLADGLYAAIVGRDGPLPFAAMALFGLVGAMTGAYQRKKALYMACRTAAGTAEPYRVTLDEKKWNGISAFSKEAGTAEGFGSQIQSMDGASRIYRIWTPVVLVAAVLCALVASVGQRELSMLTWCLSTILVAAAPVAGLMAFGQPYLKLTKRLDRSGTVLAGWDGVESMTGKANILVKDEDLFPEGSIIMKSIKPFGDISLEKITGCTASILRCAGSGLYHLFDTELRRMGGFYRRAEDLECYEAGGLTANIRDEQVLIGTQRFMKVMNVPMESGLRVRLAVHCAIDGVLKGIFSLEYEMSHSSKEAVRALVRGGVRPVLALRDFNVNPSMLQSKYELPAEQMEYPPIERRRELSEPGQPHNPVLGALLTRDGMNAYSDAVLGGRRLYAVVRLNAIIAVLASLVGVVLAFYLTWARAFDSLTPISMMIFLLIWAIPNLAISGAADRF